MVDLSLNSRNITVVKEWEKKGGEGAPRSRPVAVLANKFLINTDIPG